MPGETFFESIKLYVGFGDAASAELRAFHPVAVGHFQAIVDDFYAVIEAHPGASAAITGGAAQIARLKTTLAKWLDTLLLGPHDEAYFEKRARIGRMHVRIDLPQAYMFTAMDRIRVHLLEVARASLIGDPVRLRRTSEALHQILDLDLAIMLETYREDLVAKNRGAERLATIGQLAAGIGHELRNPLGVIESSLFLLRQHLGDRATEDPKVARHLDKIATEVNRSTKTIADLLELARSRPPRREMVDLARVVAEAREAANLPPEVTLDLAMPAGVTVDADPGQMAQVLANLFANASQAMGGRGVIHVEASRSPGRTNVGVRDEGPGVPPEVRNRIFEALFTTKARGTGLGLALCRRIADAHGGSVDLDPTERGARFLVVIPDRAFGGGP